MNNEIVSYFVRRACGPLMILLAGTLFTHCKSNTVNANYPENRAIIFDGVDDYVDLGNIYDNLALPVTISVWIWLDPDAAEGFIPIFDSQDGLPEYNGFNFLTSNISVIGVQYGDGVGENHKAYRRGKSASISPIMGRWVNFTAVLRGATEMQLYVDGVDVGGNYSGESNLPMQSNSPGEVAKIGYLFQNGSVVRFKGRMDELKIWNRTLNGEEIKRVIFKRLDETEPGLIGYWNFDEAAGTTLIDHSANHFDGALKGNPKRTLSEVPLR
ncbi:MAG TPA: LamG domain-containing protein [Chryseolinea sp.]